MCYGKDTLVSILMVIDTRVSLCYGTQKHGQTDKTMDIGDYVNSILDIKRTCILKLSAKTFPVNSITILM